MKKYTQEEFDQFPVNEYGYKQCPTGDYTLIKSFHERCSFCEWCSFSERCSFGEWCSFSERCSFGECCKCEFGEFQAMYTAGGFGSQGRTTYFFYMADTSVCVRCGCFAGTIDEWESRVRNTHGNNKLSRDYLNLGKFIRSVCQ